MTQRPGMVSSLDRSLFSQDEDKILSKLARVWFITFARVANFKSSRYAFVFAKPTERLINDFHLGREVLVLFSYYNSFEPRTLDFVDKTIAEYQNRLDKLCVVIVSQDQDIRGKIQQIVMQDKESRILIPYRYNELLDNPFSDKLVADRLREYFHTRDLFAYDSPLRSDTYFYGRTQTVQQLYGKYKSGENGCLFGLRRIGKTSVLLAVKRLLQLREEPGLFLDCSETSFHRRRWNEALFFMVNSFRQNMDLNSISLHSESEYDDKNASRVFEDDLKAIHRALDKKRLLFILDEIENITFDISPSTHWATGQDYIFFWQAVRSVFHKNAGLFSFIIAGVNPKAIETPTVHSYDNPIYRFITPTYLGFFDVREVKEMVSSIGNYMGIQFEDEVFTYLTDDYGGHPFLIRQVCSKIHESINDPRPFAVSKFRYNNDRHRLSRSIQDYIGLIVNILRERYIYEYELLEYLAQGDIRTFNEFVEMSDTVIEHLIGYGLISSEYDQYHFRIKAVEDYIRRQTKITKSLTTREDKWKEITSQRNMLEFNLRRVVKMALKLSFGAKAKETLLEVISPPDRKLRLAALNLDEIFESEMYFEDLRKIIVKHWSEMGRIFGNDREHFNTYMEYVNKYRIDAHAKDVDENTLGILLISLQWLRRQVDSFLA
jgi:hypothetical protein